MNQAWKFNKDVTATPCAPGVERKILAHTNELMCVENYFKEGVLLDIFTPMREDFIK